MATSNRKETVSTVEKTQAALDALGQKYPGWVDMLSRFAENPKEQLSKDQIPIGKAFSQFLYDACIEIKQGNMEEADFLSLFPKEFNSAIVQLTMPFLQSFRAFKPIHSLYRESPSKVENLIDQIWQQFVLRFNPYRKFERPSGMTNEDMANLERALDSLADFCSVRMLHYDGIVQRVKRETGAPDELCAYVARKIDKDYFELRMNYIVSTLERLTEPDDRS